MVTTGEQTANTPTRSVFVASPIGSAGSDGHRQAKLALDYLVRKALTMPDWEVLRADEEVGSDSINQAVVRRLVESDLVVVDLSDHNPNVFYELAIAHCYRTKVVTIASRGTSIPFDIVDQRTIFYDLSDPESLYDAQARLSAAAVAAVESTHELVTPVSAMARLEHVSDQSPAGEGALVDVLEGISVRLGRLEQRSAPVSTGSVVMGESMKELRSRLSRIELRMTNLIQIREALVDAEADTVVVSLVEHELHEANEEYRLVERRLERQRTVHRP